MSWCVLIILVGSCGLLMIAERMGLPTTLTLQFKGDVKRETRWLAQYGQSLCTPIAALLVFQLDPHAAPIPLRKALILLGGVTAASILALILKRCLGRIRPGREGAGKFLGPTFRHANFRESFPSSHSACAISMSAILAVWYPQAAATFWGLGIACAVLRWVLDAHWPSDVLGGISLGYGVAYLTLQVSQGWL